MFTGIIQAVGRIRSRTRAAEGAVVTVECPFQGLVLGESIAVDGVCLTVTAARDGTFTADASAETLARTTVGTLAVGVRVNLERALAVGDRLGGHIVAGHVDGMGRVAARENVGAAERWTVETPPEVLRYLADKGSVAMDGVSLTVNRVGPRSFEVMLVPFTRTATALDDRRPGVAVNLEVDVLARYVARALEHRGDGRGGATERAGVSGDGGVTLELLERHGFVAR